MGKADENENERLVYEFVAAAKRPPTLQEIADALGKTKSTIQGAVRRLLAKGRLIKRPGSRGLEAVPLAAPPVALRVPGAGCELEILGLVAAGKPLAPPEPPGIGYFDFRAEFGREGNQMLEVRGRSMVGAGILDGDLIVVEPAECAEPGDIVVVRVNGGYTLKVYRKRRGRVFLEPCNEEVQPIEVTPGDEAQVVGVYAGLVRKRKRRRGR